MDYKIKRQGMICASADAESRVYHKVLGKSGRYWFYPENEMAGNVYVTPKPEENKPGYKGFRGFGGREITFPLVDGTIDKIKGPWHSNSDALFEDTGVDLRNKHLTFGVISRGVKSDPDNPYVTIMTDVLYIDENPTIGSFKRIEELAKEISNKEGKPVQCYSESRGGSSRGMVKPTWMEVVDNMHCYRIHNWKI